MVLGGAEEKREERNDTILVPFATGNVIEANAIRGSGGEARRDERYKASAICHRKRNRGLCQ